MKRMHAFISGEVQGVGYREEIKRIAYYLNICGWTINLEDGRVEIIAEGENKNIEYLKEEIRTGFADVKEDTSDMKSILSRIEIDI